MELKVVFKNEYKKIAKALGMDINANKSDYQIISNTPEFAFISDQQVTKLKEIRKGVGDNEKRGRQKNEKS